MIASRRIGAGSRRRVPRIARALPVLVALVGCGESSAPIAAPTAPPAAGRPIHLTDVTAETGIDVTWTSGRAPSTQIVEVKGGGVALVDVDRDGDLDVFVPNGATMDAPDEGPGCRLYENLGDLRFRDATADAGLAFRRWGIGVAVGDVDGDGWDDLYVTCFGANALLRNTGRGTFEEITERAGVGGDAWSAAAAFGDLDGDGDLDLYVANYVDFDLAHPPAPSTFKGAPVFRGPIGLVPAPDVLYENLGDGTFRDVTVEAGCARPDPGYGLGVAILDFDGDGRQDVYVGNDSSPNFLWRNETPPGGALAFGDVAATSGLAVNVDGSAQSTMGIAVGDVDGSGWPDVFTTNFSNDSNTLHVNKSGRFFDDETRRYGLGMSSFALVGWAAAFLDLDLDADEDLVLFNGHVYSNASRQTMDSDYLQPAMLYERRGGRFVPIADDSAGPWLHEPHCDRGAAFGDLDRDGDVDVVVVELRGPVRVLRNDAIRPDDPPRRDWLIVALEPASYGSRIDLRTPDLVQHRWIFSGGSFASASAAEAHFGVPPTATALELTIAWPDGTIQTLSDVEPGRRLVIPHP